MKIDNLTIRGFRGFNQEKTIELHPTITLIYGLNSYGKTSITEAAEWLLYGKTSKVDRGESKDEYKGSYRNCHIEAKLSTNVKAVFISEGKPIIYEAELIGDDGVIRHLDGNPIEQWPINSELAAVSKPFIMQHAMKYLLLVSPDARFKGFARLLGLDELGEMQSDFVSICTKPIALIPNEVAILRAQNAAIENRLAARPVLIKIYSLYKKGKGSFLALLDAVSNECKKRVPAETDEKSLFPNLLRIRNDALKKVFPGNIILIPYSQEDIINNASDIEYYIKFASIDLIKRYGELISLAAQDTVIKQVEFYKLGFDFLTINPSECPFCGQTINNTIAEHINQKHQEAIDHIELSRKLINQRREVEYALSELTKRLEKSHQRHLPRLNTFLSINDSFDKLTQILLPKYEPYVNSIREAVVQLQEVKTQLNQCVIAASASLKALQLSIQQSKEDVNLMTELGKNLIAYAGILSSSTTIISKLNAPMSDASEILKHELDTVAGTEDISLLIELNEKQDQMKKGFEIESILEGLKELRKTVDQYVGSKMLDAVSNEMTTDVLDWYNQIRTSGDPDVHFTGFDMDRITKGEIKSRRVQIKASSYGKELVSAVSSLSESKLNALGLCLSIATNLKPGCPFDFLFIDDPIQSWDEEHGEQFIEVVRKLIAKQKQIIILSHNAKWIAQVRTGCSSLNGFYYEITSYNKNGPNIIQKPWCSWRQRVAEIDNILKDPDADKIRLQHAEGEIRLVISELTSDLYFKKKNMHKDANKLNAGDVRKCLFECGLPLTLIDQIEQTFVTTDDAHHVPSYAPQPERIKRYLNYVHELAKN